MPESPSMDDLGVRLLVVGGVLLAAAVAAFIARRFGTAHHPPVDVGGLNLPAGIVLFTSTTCSKCKEALSRAKATGAPLREITYEIEAARFEEAGVDGVPLLLVMSASGEVVEQLAGLPGRRRLRRALDRAGV